MTPTEEKALTVYKASAGSGKTFTLSVEYIKLLIKNPMSFRSTLAVTFTNKATEEMKTRILSQLYGIWKQLPKSKDYIEKIKSELGVTEQFMSDRAKIALFNIVHNYSYFRIETIDSFFQSVLRNLARELDLTANLRIELNDRQIESIAVDEMIDELGEKDELLKWILGYIKENIDDDKNWNVIGYIKSFGENIFREFYKTKSKELNTLLHEKGFFEQYTKRIRTIRDEAEAELKSVAAEFFEALETEGVDIADLSYGKSGPAGYFIKLQNGQYDESIITSRVQKALDEGSADCWTKKSAPPSLRHFAEETIVPLLEKAESTRRSNWKMYASAVLTLKHLNQLRLLNSIERKVREMNVEANRFLLSDTHTLLHSLIKDTDSPFIFEKIGSHLENVMIDEFQDTSTVQWQNFKVLLEECMSHSEEHGNLIVGDVKQSIYRWRQGDWRLLANLSQSFGKEAVCEKTLATNYRSWERIIQFNNAIFTRLVEETVGELSADKTPQATLLARAYDDVKQGNAKGQGKGYVEVALFPSKDYRENILARLADTVRRLIEGGARQKDIAILVRSKSPVQYIADYFVEEFGQSVRIVSDEAFRLDASLAVNVMVLALRLLAHPEDNLTRAALVKAYRNDVLQEGAPLPHLLVTTRDEVVGKTERPGRPSDEEIRKRLEVSLPDRYVREADQLRNLPLLDLVDTLHALFQLDQLKNQSAYVCLFYDKLNDYLRDRPADIDDFLTEWDNTISQKTIQSDEVEGVRIMTIHKSKGLEFDNVIIPFCDWQLEKGNTLWCEKGKREKPFDELPITPVDFSRNNLVGTVYEDDYREEHFQNAVDNLNLLYVAFTRAGKRLFVTGKRMSESQKKKFTGLTSQRSQGLELCLEQVAADLGADCSFQGKDQTEEALELVYGTLEGEDIVGKGDKTASDNPFESPSETQEIRIETHKTPIGFRQSNKSEEFVRGEETDAPTSYIKMGTILHQLFSSIRTEEDIEPHISQLVSDGIITDDRLIAQLRKQVEASLANPTVAEWFRPGWKLYNECSILQYNPADGTTIEQRPDRVMSDDEKTIVVDYKFAKPRPEHATQVKSYIELLRKIGHKNVSGFLWYVLRNEVVAVEV